MPPKIFLQRFDARDLTELFAYEEEYGPLDVGSRLDVLFAHLAAHIVAIFAKEGTELDVRKFLPRWARRAELTLEQEAAAGRALMESL